MLIIREEWAGGDSICVLSERERLGAVHVFYLHVSLYLSVFVRSCVCVIVHVLLREVFLLGTS